MVYYGHGGMSIWLPSYWYGGISSHDDVLSHDGVLSYDRWYIIILWLMKNVFIKNCWIYVVTMEQLMQCYIFIYQFCWSSADQAK